ncbi:MAG: NAD(P)H-dependent oxidoreductase subunit E [Candidatus Neomarinimicrobiota bacterium]
MSEHNISEIMKKYSGDPSTLIAILQDVQEEYRHLPQDALTQVADGLKVPLSRVFSVATFFKSFSLEPRGIHTISVCTGTACEVWGAKRLVEKIGDELGISTGGTTKDLAFTLKEINCPGCCGLAPVLMIGNDVYGKVKQSKVMSIVKKYEK